MVQARDGIWEVHLDCTRDWCNLKLRHHSLYHTRKAFESKWTTRSWPGLTFPNTLFGWLNTWDLGQALVIWVKPEKRLAWDFKRVWQVLQVWLRGKVIIILSMNMDSKSWRHTLGIHTWGIYFVAGRSWSDLCHQYLLFANFLTQIRQHSMEAFLKAKCSMRFSRLTSVKCRKSLCFYVWSRLHLEHRFYWTAAIRIQARALPWSKSTQLWQTMTTAQIQIFATFAEMSALGEHHTIFLHSAWILHVPWPRCRSQGKEIAVQIWALKFWWANTKLLTFRPLKTCVYTYINLHEGITFGHLRYWYSLCRTSKICIRDDSLKIGGAILSCESKICFNRVYLQDPGVNIGLQGSHCTV